MADQRVLVTQGGAGQKGHTLPGFVEEVSGSVVKLDAHMPIMAMSLWTPWVELATFSRQAPEGSSLPAQDRRRSAAHHSGM